MEGGGEGARGGGGRGGEGGHSSQEHLLPPLRSPYISLSIVSCVKQTGRGPDAPRRSAALNRQAAVTLIQRRSLPPQRRYFAHFVHKTPFLGGMTGLAFILLFPPSHTRAGTHTQLVLHGEAVWKESAFILSTSIAAIHDKTEKSYSKHRVMCRHAESKCGPHAPLLTCRLSADMK